MRVQRVPLRRPRARRWRWWGRTPSRKPTCRPVRWAIDAGAWKRRCRGSRAGWRTIAPAGYRLYADCAAGRRSAEEIIAALEQANLRGLGGAGFRPGASGAWCATCRRRA